MSAEARGRRRLGHHTRRDVILNEAQQLFATDYLNSTPSDSSDSSDSQDYGRPSEINILKRLILEGTTWTMSTEGECEDGSEYGENDVGKTGSYEFLCRRSGLKRR